MRPRSAFPFRRLAVPPLEAPEARFSSPSAPNANPGSLHQRTEGEIMSFMNNAKQLVGIADRRCGTCRWWPGEREIKFMSQRPFKVETTGNAKCQARGTSVSGGQSHCSKWTKWERLP